MEAQQIDALVKQLQTLPSPKQQRVMDFVNSLETEIEEPRGTPGHTLMHLSGTLPDEDAREMMAAIEEGCGQIDKDGWD